MLQIVLLYIILVTCKDIISYHHILLFVDGAFQKLISLLPAFDFLICFFCLIAAGAFFKYVDVLSFFV